MKHSENIQGGNYLVGGKGKESHATADTPMYINK